MPQDPPLDLQLSESDVRAIVRLLGEVIAMRADINTCRRALMGGLCPLVGADSWLWCMAEIEAGKSLSHSGILYGGFDDERFSWFLQAINHPSLGKANRVAARKLMGGESHITLPLAQIDDPEFPIFAGESGPCWRKADIGTLMLSMHSIGNSTATGVGFYRRLGRPDFDERERRIAHIMLTEVSWLHYAHYPERDALARLYPRHRTVLNLLCEGWPRKKIAAHLGISENTVHGYVKNIYRHFGVNSQAGLMARFSKGDGGDRS